MNSSASASENETSISPVLNKEPSNVQLPNAEVDYKEIKKKIPSDFDTWTECKKQAWLHLDDNPNTFFYRHVMPGEEIKKGPWSEDEKTLFLKALKEHPPIKGHWGLFSRYIPTRVGYQCNAFYKKLVSSGEVEEIVAINKKSTSSNNNNSNKNNNIPNINSSLTSISSSNNSINTATTNSFKRNSNRRKYVSFESSGSPRLQSIVSFLFTSRKNTSLFDDLDISLINRRPATPLLSKNKIVFDGTDYAYNNNLIQSQKKDFVFNPELNSRSSFQEILANNLKDPKCEEKFDNLSDLYFNI
ncbi:hypothetical protein M9Y10_022386 [Tritrichomonas musculus]|uniref:Myb-like DNA-binding domain containing protein n=1 Tax=Tritrichomonas musculus TaxID=1915356 RepID=A0ABR2KU35_9EUKA